MAEIVTHVSVFTYSNHQYINDFITLFFISITSMFIY